MCPLARTVNYHPVPRRKVSNGGANGGDDTRAFVAHVVVLDYPQRYSQVVEVEGGGFDANEDLVITKGGVVLGEGDEVEGFEEADFAYSEGEGGVGIVR